IVLEAKGVGKCFDNKRIFAGAEFTLERGDKVAFVGRNGEGKTTFARMIVGDTPVTEGVLRTGHNVSVGYYAQNQEDLMNGDFTVFDTLDRVAVGDIRTKLRDILGAFLFRGDDIDKKVKVLSGGERSRLAMARLMLNPYNLLILDEPTNHMDMRSKDVLKRALKEYDGTLIVVSHDREFLEGLVSKVYEFSDGRVREHLGGIDDFLYRHKIESMAQIEASSAGKASSGAAAVKDASSEASVKAGGRQRSFHEQKELERARRKLRVAVDNAEAEIERIERAIREYDNKMADPQAYGLDMSDASLFDDYNTLKSQYNKEMNKWEAATEALDDFDAKNGF
ncbi:MAG: ATP-binding cassette domain-containing protein, partial [Rikenellaceae bacterium]|nr:ATP-binding cassette domain-containing protein [Rikenellaceae bacterium]